MPIWSRRDVIGGGPSSGGDSAFERKAYAQAMMKHVLESCTSGEKKKAHHDEACARVIHFRRKKKARHGEACA